MLKPAAVKRCETLAEALSVIMAAHGTDVLLDDQRLIASLKDCLPKGMLERQVLKNAFERNIPQKIADVCGKERSDQQIVMTQCVKILRTEFGTVEGIAEAHLWTLAEALGWESRPESARRGGNLTERQEESKIQAAAATKPLDSTPAGKNYIDPRYGIEMVFVEGGTFMMGASPGQEVTLSDFYIGKYLVTQAQWKAVMGKKKLWIFAVDNNPSHYKIDNGSVNQVSWNDTQEFIKKLYEETGKDYRLPTEAEWEYVVCGGNKSSGYKDRRTEIEKHVESVMAGIGYRRGSRQAEELGVYDINGDTNEWVSDWDGDGINNTQTNPQCPSTGSKRVVRGGISPWIEGRRPNLTFVSFTDRQAYDPGKSYSNLSFRLALSSK